MRANTVAGCGGDALLWRASVALRSLCAVFLDAFLPNLVLFLLGQAAAWYYLHTGRFWVGAAATAGLWVLADWALVAKYAFGAAGPDFTLPLLGMQVVAVVTATLLAVALWRRRWSTTAKQRSSRFRAGLEAYLRDELSHAQKVFTGLVRCNPWDAAAWLALGNVQRRLGRVRQAAACYRRALGVDRSRDYHDLVRQQQGRLLRAAGAAPVAVAAPAGERGASASEARPSPQHSRRA